MRAFALMLLAAVLAGGVVVMCHRDDIKHVQSDYQAYQKRSLLPEDMK